MGAPNDEQLLHRKADCPGSLVILPEVRDPRMITIRRGGSLTDADHCLLALWTADCAEHDLGAAA